MAKKKYSLLNDKHRLAALKSLREKKKKPLASQDTLIPGTGQLISQKKLPAISEKAAKLIALALSNMMKN